MKRLLYTILIVAGLVTPPQSPGMQNDMGKDEEALIRAAYEKLTTYQRAAVLEKLEWVESRVTPDLVLDFHLKNFHTGNVDEINLKPLTEVITVSDGDMVQVTRGIHRMNNGPEEAAYSAYWTQTAPTEAWSRFTVAELLQSLGRQGFGLVRFTSYDVTVHFEGKSRTYKALVLFEDMKSAERRLEFLDYVGAGGMLTKIHQETLPPLKNRLYPQKSDN